MWAEEKILPETDKTYWKQGSKGWCFCKHSFQQVSNFTLPLTSTNLLQIEQQVNCCSKSLTFWLTDWQMGWEDLIASCQYYTTTGSVAEFWSCH